MMRNVREENFESQHSSDCKEDFQEAYTLSKCRVKLLIKTSLRKYYGHYNYVVPELKHPSIQT